MASLPVAQNVQEMVRNNPLKIPEKFILKNIDQQDKPNNTRHDLSSDDIPIIDLSLLSSGHREELNKLDLACKEWGFFQLVNHGVAREVMQSMKEGSAKFFDLPLEEKNKISISLSNERRQGYGQPFVATEEQTLDWSDALVLPLYPSECRNLEFWPTTPKGFKLIILWSFRSKNKEELDKLDMACNEWGFFQMLNHGVAKEVLQGMKDVAAEFFELPLEEKNKISMPSDDIQGYGHAYVVSEDQILDWSDALILIVYPSHYRKLQFWPAAPEKLKEVLEAYSREVKRVGEELLRSLSILMGMEQDSLIGLHNQMLQGLRVNYYPPCSMSDNVLGLSPHSDTSTITILMQEDNVTGLQIQKGGEWVSVKPIPNALVVNVGDVLEIWTNGKYKSIEHRAVTTKTKARLSYASFLAPHDDVEVEPVYHIAESHMMYKKVRYGDYLRQSMKMKHEGKAHTQMAKIEN